MRARPEPHGERRPAFRVYIAQSLDGFIATIDGGVEWLAPFPAGLFGFESFIERIGTIVMGRTTYEQVRTFGDWPYAATRTIVLTSHALDDPPELVEAWQGGVAGLTAELEASEERDVWVLGGARTITTFLEADRIDQIELFVIPVLLGAGVPLLDLMEPRPLRLDAAEPLDYGVVRLEYRVV